MKSLEFQSMMPFYLVFFSSSSIVSFRFKTTLYLMRKLSQLLEHWQHYQIISVLFDKLVDEEQLLHFTTRIISHSFNFLFSKCCHCTWTISRRSAYIYIFGIWYYYYFFSFVLIEKEKIQEFINWVVKLRLKTFKHWISFFFLLIFGSWINLKHYSVNRSNSKAIGNRFQSITPTNQERKKLWLVLFIWLLNPKSFFFTLHHRHISSIIT